MTARDMYHMDRYTMEDMGLQSVVLMENAGRAVVEKLMEKLRPTDEIMVLAGGGHNGGDGFVVGRTLHNLEYAITVMQVVPDKKLTEETLHQKRLFIHCGGEVIHADSSSIQNQLSRAAVIVDAITGLGIKGQLRPPLAGIVGEVNSATALVCAIDIPSGLPADEGSSDFTSVQADMTVVIGAVKESAFVQRTSEYYGEWELVHIGHPTQAFSRLPSRFIMDAKTFHDTMPRRTRYSHKGSHGKGLLIGGSNLMPGSVVLAGRAALRTGAGLLTIASTDRVIGHVANHLLESTYMALPEHQGEIIPNETLEMKGFDAVTIGVGLGRREETGVFLTSVLRAAECPLIIDADGIYHLRQCLDEVRERTHPTIITPHPGEAARLLDVDVPTLLHRPFHYSRELAETYNMYVILKGKATIITSPKGEAAVDITGNPGLAKGGSGDVLTGIVLAMVLQHQSIFQGLCNACFVHGTAADLQMEDLHTVYDLMASDVIDRIPAVYRTLL